MSDFSITRERAYELLGKYTKRENLLRHGIAVGAAMRHFAEKFGEDAAKWEVIGLLHDVDYEMYPEQHCHKSGEILKQEGFPPDWVQSVQSHGWKIMGDNLPEPQHIMEKTLYMVDQLTGLVAATALMRPSKSILDMGAKSVKKKFKDKAFAAKVDREVIRSGAQMVGIELGEAIAETIEGLKPVAAELGLAGES